MLMAGPPFYVQAVFVNRCGSPSVCDFVCDCWDCSDENQCGYQKASALGAPFTCTFEGTLCGWEDISNTAYRWDPAQASLSTGLQLPFDHTLGTDLGWYMAATKQRTKPSGPARLRSPLLQGAAAACEIRAWYHLWGSGLNETQQPLLTLELRQGNRTVRLWQSPPGGTYSWQELVAYTGHIPGSFQVTFSAVRGSSSTAQLALDDVEFRNCGFPRPQTCGPEAFHCQQGGCIAKDRVCDGTADCRAGEDEATADCASFTACSFEGDWCQWTVVPNATLPWLRNSSLHLASPSVWPSRDHSTNSREGFFAYVETQKPDLHEGRAWLSSPVLAPDSPQPCYLVLYLHLHGSSSNSLNVYSQTAEALRLVWSRTGDLGSYWFREKVDFTEAKKFKIIIEGRIGSGHEGSIALDDLRLSPHCRAVQDAQLPTPPVLQPSSPCPGGQFACDQGKRCLDFQLLCNFKAECEDASDEQQCGMTDFAKDPGGWMDISVGRLRWTASRLGPVGPIFGLQEGPGQMFSMARAATPVLGPSGSGCVLQMDFTTGPEGFLALAIADESPGTHWWAWFARSNGTASWAEATVPLGARRRPFQLELLATKGPDGPRGPPPLAVSNISFVNCSAEAPASAPPAGLSCNFETDRCGWYPEQNDGFEWRLSRSRGGAVDHTTGTGSAAEGLGWGADFEARVGLGGPSRSPSGLHPCAEDGLFPASKSERGTGGELWLSLAQNDLLAPEIRSALERRVSRRVPRLVQNSPSCHGALCCLAASGSPPPPSPTGSFLFVDPGGPWNPGWRARLVSAPQAAAATVVESSCLSFWYRMDGPQIGTLALKVKEAGESGEQVLWTRTGSHGAVWHRAVSSISPKPGQKYQVILEALRDGFLGSIAVDDITVTPGACPAQHHCSFEADECGFSVPKQQAWQRQNGTEGWGPPVDHTVGEPRGHYMILCTGADKLPSGQVTVLRSRTFPPLLRTHCVSFWYYLSGSDPGSLTAYVVEEKEQETEMGMFTLAQTQGAAWRYGSFVAKVHGRWQVAFAVGGAGGGPASYIALDDIFVREGGCSEPGSCDFESGPCGWSKPPGNWYSWDWKAAATTLRSPSPQEDHTLGTNAGHYAYVDLAVLSLGKSTARLASEPLAPTTGSCLRFHYHMDFLGHSSSAELRVRLTGAQGERVIWTATGHQSWTWMNQTLLVTSLVEFQIVLEASSGAWVSSGVIALDDLHYTAGPDCASPQAGQAEESSSSSPLPVSTIGVVAGVVSTVLLLLLLLAATCCLWKRRGSRERMEEEYGNGQGFDNIAFRDDRIILPRMAPNPAAS